MGGVVVVVVVQRYKEYTSIIKMRQPIIYPLHDNDGYKSYEQVVSEQIKKCVNVNDMDFKSNPDYCQVLEHVDQGFGYKYLNLIQQEFPDSLDKLDSFIELNDKYGKSNKCTIDKYYCSPTSLRYFYQALLILKYIEELEVNDIDIVEIGGGYGGLCLALYFLNKNINSYTICDLLPVMKLQEMYLNTFNISLSNEIKQNSILISCYGLSELDVYTRDRYIDALNTSIQHGFIVWNVPGCDIEQILKRKCTIVPERPMTRDGNVFVYYTGAPPP